MQERTNLNDPGDEYFLLALIILIYGLTQPRNRFTAIFGLFLVAFISKTTADKLPSEQNKFSPNLELNNLIFKLDEFNKSPFSYSTANIEPLLIQAKDAHVNHQLPYGDSRQQGKYFEAVELTAENFWKLALKEFEKKIDVLEHETNPSNCLKLVEECRRLMEILEQPIIAPKPVDGMKKEEIDKIIKERKNNYLTDEGYRKLKDRFKLIIKQGPPPSLARKAIMTIGAMALLVAFLTGLKKTVSYFFKKRENDENNIAPEAKKPHKKTRTKNTPPSKRVDLERLKKRKSGATATALNNVPEEEIKDEKLEKTKIYIKQKKSDLSTAIEKIERKSNKLNISLLSNELKKYQAALTKASIRNLGQKDLSTYLTETIQNLKNRLNAASDEINLDAIFNDISEGINKLNLTIESLNSSIENQIIADQTPKKSTLQIKIKTVKPRKHQETEAEKKERLTKLREKKKQIKIELAVKKELAKKEEAEAKQGVKKLRTRNEKFNQRVEKLKLTIAEALTSFASVKDIGNEDTRRYSKTYLLIRVSTLVIEYQRTGNGLGIIDRLDNEKIRNYLAHSFSICDRKFIDNLFTQFENALIPQIPGKNIISELDKGKIVITKEIENIVSCNEPLTIKNLFDQLKVFFTTLEEFKNCNDLDNDLDLAENYIPVTALVCFIGQTLRNIRKENKEIFIKIFNSLNPLQVNLLRKLIALRNIASHQPDFWGTDREIISDIIPAFDPVPHKTKLNLIKNASDLSKAIAEAYAQSMIATVASPPSSGEGIESSGVVNIPKN